MVEIEKIRGNRKTKTGVVVSTKMDKTAIVRVERVFAHPQYSKVVRTSKKYYAHNLVEGIKKGDTVRIVESRPISRLKRWRILECV
ncbi:MAG: 30S ribosomal protein S17 [Victivallaceae bacterium]